ncbi:MAG TPA: cytochrome c3 family protein [Gemmatimonadales bacterium]|nr:cytochrome c3 family protein [Gemmatimonadales bacterium]
MTAPAGWRQRIPRLLRVLIPLAILGVILLAVTTVGFIEYSARPGFCKSCHIMQPYYDSWAGSSHRDVPCIKCHYAPGIKAEAMGKLQAANQVVKYVTGAYGVKPWAEIEDAACLRSGCHSERKVEGAVDYLGVQFDHAKHLGELRRGKQLRCTSCHSQIVQGAHLAVTEVTCFLCHFKDRPPEAPLAGCTGCHPFPPRVESTAGVVVEHAQYVQHRVSCVSCHSEMTAGSGSAERARCFNCHNEPERLDQFENTALIHRLHIAEKNVECTQCHTPIEHRVVSLNKTFELDCRSCHSQTHDAQRRLFAGMGGHETENTPSKMFLARVSCVGCHGMSTNVRGHERVRVAGEASCLACHGIRYANMLPSWQRSMERRLSQVQPVVAGARARVGAVPLRRRAVADSLVRLAEENLDLVRLGKAAHNMAYADKLLRAAVTLVREAVSRGALPYTVPVLELGPPVGEGECLSCHAGIERTRVSFQGRPFDHAPHVVRGGLGCPSCHTPLDRHGGTTLGSPGACAGCHHQAERSCLSCHRTSPLEIHTADVHGGCVACHEQVKTITRWSPQVCTVCHRQQATDHYPGSCETCHEMPARRPEV